MGFADTASVAPTTLSPVNPRSGAAHWSSARHHQRSVPTGSPVESRQGSLLCPVILEPAENIGGGSQRSQIRCDCGQPAHARGKQRVFARVRRDERRDLIFHQRSSHDEEVDTQAIAFGLVFQSPTHAPHDVKVETQLLEMSKMRPVVVV